MCPAGGEERGKEGHPHYKVVGLVSALFITTEKNTFATLYSLDSDPTSTTLLPYHHLILLTIATPIYLT